MYKLLFLFAPMFLLNACTRSRGQTIPVPAAQVTNAVDTSAFIPKDSAKRMIASYMESLAGNVSDSLFYWSLDARHLRTYLADTSVRQLKIQLAHTAGHINSGNYGKPSGFTPGALTVILTGINDKGAEVYYDAGYVLNRAKPCPPACLIENIVSPAER